MSSQRSTPSGQPTLSLLDLESLPALSEFGFTGGRDGFHRFCAAVFQRPSPRFLRSPDDSLAVFRHADLTGLSRIADIANVPPGVLFPGLTHEIATGTLSAEPRAGTAVAAVISNQFFTNNPPLHGPIRKTLFNQISPKQTALMEDLARDTARGILAECAHQSEIDFTSDIAEKLTARFWGSILGMTPQEVVDVAAAVHDLTPLFFMDRSAEDTTRLERGAARYGQLVEGAAMRSVSGGGGHPMLAAIASALTNLDFAEDLATVGIVPRNVGAFMAGNLVDGFHTAALAATNTLYTLLRFPEVLAQVRAAPELLPRAILEALRLEPPVLMLKRYVLQDVTYDGMLIPKGTLISMMWAAGNHDPSVFADPTQFNLTRSHQGITIFGGGTHICPGRYVALMLTRILIEALDTNGIALELVDHACHWYDGHVMAQLKAMPVKIKSSQR